MNRRQRRHARRVATGGAWLLTACALAGCPSPPGAPSSETAASAGLPTPAPLLRAEPVPVEAPVGLPRLAHGDGWLLLAWTERGLGTRGDALFFSARSFEDGRWRDRTPLSQTVASGSSLQLVSARPRAVAVSWSAPIGGGQLRPWIATSDDAGRRFSAPEILASAPAGATFLGAPLKPGGPWRVTAPASEAATPTAAPISMQPPTPDAHIEALQVCAGGGPLALWCDDSDRASLGTIAAAHAVGTDARCVPGPRPLACRRNRIAVAARSAGSGEAWLWVGQSPTALRRLAPLPGVVTAVPLVTWVDDAHVLAVWIDDRRTVHATTTALDGGPSPVRTLATGVLDASATVSSDPPRLYVAWTTSPAAADEDRGPLQLGSLALPDGMLAAPSPTTPLDPRGPTR
ncbi:MAG: hypothetical protein ACPHRO_03125 [Nannocystaceae bacterium]